MLDAGVASGLVVKDAENNIYTGFLQWKNVMDSSCQFESMNSNRAVNEDVVEARVSDNLRELAENQRFRDFGQINLLVLLNDPGHVFYVMDGQHRCKVMDRLHRKTGKDIKFQFRAKVVADEAEAHQELWSLAIREALEGSDGSRFKSQGCAGVGLCFRLPRGHFGYIFLSHSQMVELDDSRLHIGGFFPQFHACDSTLPTHRTQP